MAVIIGNQTQSTFKCILSELMGRITKRKCFIIMIVDVWAFHLLHYVQIIQNIVAEFNFKVVNVTGLEASYIQVHS